MTFRLREFDGGITAAKGFLAAGVSAGLKKRGKDLALIVNSGGAVPAVGAFTSNLVKGAPIYVTMKRVERGKIAAIVANSGYSNVLTGERGIRDAERMAELAAEELGLNKDEVAVASTGVIGKFLPMDRIEQGIKAAAKTLSSSRQAARDAAEAIMTTDTFPKESAVKLVLSNGAECVVAGMAKGAGMIAPRLRVHHATMLSFIVTDASVEHSALLSLFKKAVERSFNCVVVDGDQSTSDMVLLLANGEAENPTISDPQHPDAESLYSALEAVMQDLAKMIAKDGEGATKFIEICVRGAETWEDARAVARAIACSPLVKTAIFGRDPNWGRIMAAAGNSGVNFDPNRVELYIGTPSELVPVLVGGVPLVQPKRGYGRLGQLLEGDHVKVVLDLGLGGSEAVVWTCDMSYDYVRINAEYTT